MPLTLSGVLLSQLRARNREEVNIENGMNLKQGDMLMLQTEAERSVIWLVKGSKTIASFYE